MFESVIELKLLNLNGLRHPVQPRLGRSVLLKNRLFLWLSLMRRAGVIPTTRIDRIRTHLAQLGERSVTSDASEAGDHRDFDNFSENTGPGDKEPSFTDFADFNQK
jgi:hypothetical protein